MDPQNAPSRPPDERQDFHPDQSFSPRDPQPAPMAPPAAPQSPTTVAQDAPTSPQPPETGGFFHPEPTSAPASAQSNEDARDSATTQSEPQEAVPQEQAGAGAQMGQAPQHVSHDTGQAVAWTASEFIAQEKNPQWYMILAGGGMVLTGIVYFLAKDVFSSIAVAIIAIIFGVAASRQPRQLRYEVNDHGLVVGNRPYSYGDFRSFSISEEDHFKSINLMPLKRFMPVMSIYYDPADEDKIAEVLTAHLPLESHKLDPVEKLMRRIRF